MKLELSQRFYFDAAHTLERQFETASSRRIHGHSYRAEVTLCGEPDPVRGMVVDLAVLRGVIAELREQLDHHFLDEVPGLAPATLENLCAWIAREVQQRLAGQARLIRVEVARPSSGDRCVLRSVNPD
jgi:6-pyruvoyltetrahydropterin/6-carboxytetrahydropterin synthase